MSAIVLVEVPADHPLRRDQRSLSPATLSTAPWATRGRGYSLEPNLPAAMRRARGGRQVVIIRPLGWRTKSPGRSGRVVFSGYCPRRCSLAQAPALPECGCLRGGPRWGSVHHPLRRVVRPGAAGEPDRGHGERPARRAGQTRGAYSIERNGQSRSSHARTVWYSTGSSSAQSARTQELTAASWSPALTLPSPSLRGG